MLRKGFVQVGVVVGTHGRWGRLRVRPTTDNPGRFLPGSVLHISGTSHTVQALASAGPHLLVKLVGVDSPQQAREFDRSVVEVPEDEVPPAPDGTYYHFQLLETQVFDATGNYLGDLDEVISTGANDVYVVRGEGTELLVPAMDDVVMSIDLAERRMVVELPEGLKPKFLLRGQSASGKPRRRRRPRPTIP